MLGIITSPDLFFSFFHGASITHSRCVVFTHHTHTHICMEFNLFLYIEFSLFASLGATKLASTTRIYSHIYILLCHHCTFRLDTIANGSTNYRPKCIAWRTQLLARISYRRVLYIYMTIFEFKKVGTNSYTYIHIAYTLT